MRYSVAVSVDGEQFGATVECIRRADAEQSGLDAVENLFAARGWQWEDMAVMAVETDRRSYVVEASNSSRLAAWRM